MMDAVCTWKEGECPKMGPINCDAHLRTDLRGSSIIVSYWFYLDAA